MTPLHQFGDAVRNVLQLIPLPVVRGIFVGLLVAILVWVLQLPKEATRPPEGSTGVDLRWGAAAAMLVQIAIYLSL